MDLYNEIHISNIERNTNENVCMIFKPGTSASLVRWRSPKYKSFCTLRNTQQTVTHFHPVRTY